MSRNGRAAVLWRSSARGNSKKQGQSHYPKIHVTPAFTL